VTGEPVRLKEKIDGCPEAQDQQSEDPQPPCGQLDPGSPGAQRLSPVRDVQVAPRRMPELWWYKGRVAVEVN